MRSIRKIATYNIPKLWYTFLAIISSIIFRKEKIAICCIAKNENLYIREWVEYHKTLGIDHITIYDNNDIDGEYFHDVLSDYIKTGFCNIIDYRGRKVCQLAAYNDYYQKYNSLFDWIAFIDCDEFITLGKNAKGTLKSILHSKRFIFYQMLHINWMCFGDNNQLDYDVRATIQRFPTPIYPLDFQWHLPFPENNHVKTIVRGGLKNVYWIHPHYCCTPYYYCCNALGNRIDTESPFTPYNFSYIYLRHYRTKSIGEYVKKIQRGYPDQTDIEAKAKLSIADFFVVNKKTPEKETYIQNLLNT